MHKKSGRKDVTGVSCSETSSSRTGVLAQLHVLQVRTRRGAGRDRGRGDLGEKGGNATNQGSHGKVSAREAREERRKEEPGERPHIEI